MLDVGRQIRFTVTPKYKDFKKGDVGRIMTYMAEYPQAQAHITLVKTNDKIVWCTSKEFEPWSQLSLLS